ncbi:Armadillo-type fold [Trichophyton rubrum]|nr:Armadillo-type fold [Trichophyton rubrum]
MPTTEERNKLRTDLKASGFEKVMGRSLRTCKEQFYPALHVGLKVWVAAAAEDGWDYQFVREGPPRDAPPTSPIKTAGNQSPKKKPGIVSEAPPRLDLNVGVASPDQRKSSGDWL